jgi:hypothetical protein
MADKLRERWYVNQLQSALTHFPAGEVLATESPDFLVQSDEQLVGVEVTVFYWSAPNEVRPHQEEQALKDRVVATAQRAHTEAGGPALYVSVFFARHSAITKGNAQKRGQELAQAVLETTPPASIDEGAVTVFWNRLPAGIVDISIRASVHERDRLWSADAGGWVAQVQPVDIQTVIDRKSRMLPVARAKCREVWLVIIDDEFSRAAPVELGEAAARHAYSHAFDRLFWLEPHQGRVHELLRLAPSPGVV